MTKKSSRRLERSFAFQVLYGISFAPVKDLDDVRTAFCNSPDFAEKIDIAQVNNFNDLQGFAWELVSGVWGHDKDLDEYITRFSRNWRLNRMGRIELTILRMGMFEMLYRSDIPPKVVLNEALELSKQFGEESARSFVKGILDATAKALEHGDIIRL